MAGYPDLQSFRLMATREEEEDEGEGEDERPGNIEIRMECRTKREICGKNLRE